MRAAQITAWGAVPKYEPRTPPLPPPTPSQIRIRVLASGLHRLARGQVTGKHYSVSHSSLPFIPGVDGVGLTPEGDVVYFMSPSGGAFAEHVNVEKKLVVELSPDARVKQVAGLVNPGLASWMALKSRIQGLDFSKDGKLSVVILGVTTLSGKLASEFARKLGFSRVVGVARNLKEMEKLALDDTILLEEDPRRSEWSKLGDVDVVLDFLYGEPALECLKALQSARPTQYVQIGVMAGLVALLPAELLRSKNITIRGSGPGSWTMAQFAAELQHIVRAVEGLKEHALETRMLEQIEATWAEEQRTVFIL
ncbi:dehydrogenase protein [Pochonia chlamydosporia 170]|uniref:Dehydrogenase protein n=1 Tax=Pochonia chlamydosporia 170 TaxID=1380566 RepID=A0A179FBN4_METCM|nr:dehydrogenase protein [Pochonia chlamydosporia 170]OAQ62720.1 dehydrogenase protein [Pochonia chlamydosporia 170]